MENWLPVSGYEGLYEVSDCGNVKSLNYNHTGKSKVLALKSHKSGYKTVMLCDKSGHKNKSVHVLVASAFLPNPENLPCVNHIDGNKSNNFVGNLEWISRKGNTQHAIATGLRADSNMRGRTGSLNPLSKPVAQYTKSGDLVKVWSGYSEAARAYGCKPCTIINCAKGRIKSCKGFVWKDV